MNGRVYLMNCCHSTALLMESGRPKWSKPRVQFCKSIESCSPLDDEDELRRSNTNGMCS
jgi:hypothetical protein